ncbi:hypothetical protein GUITHDRAFT_99367 [Guillardia theta CCMP2712]|uniref:BZIP domain-containing protein n=1 Tax=Guillardia theta (strain CCMP2712) TaxID=905079 RepID=L1K2A1_GUITC|nr:hypothetical protein GUITHDRAFT_99367 [Guillardia theta CCMP2712]EKX54709.1 hypothetical protein GUITHDRAFT_99367 [Guillardia theta CCMP2712]|eukprot:XP_005841689.1 hypothetical protein GUITHDRAFT_99367 [Guillardia theta CCMP2712]
MRKPCQPHELLEQELSMLLKNQKKGDEAETPEDDSAKEIKNRVRTIKNRLAAKKSRDQARSYVQRLESNLTAVVSHNEALLQRIAVAEGEIERLRSENNALKHRVTELMSDPNNASKKLGPDSRSAPSSSWIPGRGKADCNADAFSKCMDRKRSSCYIEDYTRYDFLDIRPETMTLEEWRKEKRRRQNREAQRRHRERRLCVHGKDVQAKQEEQSDAQSPLSSIEITNSEEQTPSNAQAEVKPEPGSSQAVNEEKPEVQIAQDRLATEDMSGFSLLIPDASANDNSVYLEALQETCDASSMDLANFPTALSRSGSLSSSLWARNDFLAASAKDVEDIFQDDVSNFDEVCC